MKKIELALFFLIFTLSFLAFGCKDRSEDVRSGVMYAENALASVGSNPFSKASYESIVGRGGTPVDYIKATLPKEKPVFDSWEFGKPTHPWTIVIRPGSSPNEYAIEGYGADVKKPLNGCVKYVTVKLPESE
jgi:hypothetical protein